VHLNLLDSSNCLIGKTSKKDVSIHFLLKAQQRELFNRPISPESTLVNKTDKLLLLEDCWR